MLHGFTIPFRGLGCVRRLVCLSMLLFLASAQGQTVAVLPFYNLSESSSFDWIGESVSETIREELATEGVAVVDRGSRDEAFRRLSLKPFARLTLASVVMVGRLVEADRVVIGSFQVSDLEEGTPKSGKGTLQLVARVIDLKQSQPGSERTASGPLEDLAEVQNRLARLVLKDVLPEGRVPAESQFLSQRKPVRLDALENYIRGLLADSPEQKHRLFTQAARLDEGFSQPCFQLGKLLLDEENYRAAAGWLERVAAGSQNAVEAQFLLGICRYELGEFEKAESSFRLAVQFIPYAEVWNNLGAAQSRRGSPEALDSFKKALEAGPKDPDYRFNLGYALWKRGEFDSAADTFRAVLDLTPEDPQAILMLGRCLKKTPAEGVAIKIEGFERIKDDYVGADNNRHASR
jgi:Flp pilus assembly protein TadD/TolB-like protein